MIDNELKSGGTKPWKEGVSKSVTFIVTKDCQLACKYCYLVGKNNQEQMSFETAKKAVDYILDNEQMFKEESIVWDFIGGEPLIEVELIDRISDYIKLKMYEMNHHWFDAYRFNLTTNGINYNSKAVQKYVEKNHDHLNIEITIDGTEKNTILIEYIRMAEGRIAM